jgi:hypothetical protein
MNSKIILLTILMIACKVPAFAQNQSIRGRVTDLDSGYPIVGVNIVLLGSGLIKGTTTDLEGNYLLTDIPVGRVSLKYTFIGYKEVILHDQLLERGKELFLNIALEEEVV